MTGKKSIMRFAVFFHVFMLSMKVNSIAIFNFHWDLLYIVDMSECEKGIFWEVNVPKTSVAAIFSGDLYIFAKYAPVFSNRSFPTTFASHRHCHVRTYVQMSGVVNRVAIWFYYRKAFATAFAVLSRAQFWLSRRDFFRNIFRGSFRRKYSS